MEAHRVSFGGNASLRERVLERLGFSRSPSSDLDGLRALYRAWCARVPFDNVRKMIALVARDGRPLPGIEARDFFDQWLAHGAGATCWPTSNALFELAQALGFDARRVAGSMRDLGVVNHASVKVRVDGRDWLLDSSMLTNEPLPLGDEIFVLQDPAIRAEIEPALGSHVIWTHTPPNADYLPCRLLIDPAEYEVYRAGYEASRERSPFNRQLYARRNHPGELRMLTGFTRWSRTASSLERRDLSAAEVCQALRDDIGLTGTLIDEWIDSGSLEASGDRPSEANPPPVGRPPSRRSGIPPDSR